MRVERNKDIGDPYDRECDYADRLDDRVTELEAEVASLRAHRCEVGMENPDATLAHLKSLPPEELESINQLTNRRKR